MALDNLREWNLHFKNAELPLELYGESPENIRPSQPFHDLGAAKLRVTQEDFLKTSAHSVPFRRVRAVLVTEPKILRHLMWKFDKKDFVLAPIIPPRVADQLRQNGIMFADQRGNCFVSWPGVLIDIRGRMGSMGSARGKSREDSLSNRGGQRTASLFTPRRAQVSALLLSSPSLLRAPIREVAGEANVSIGTANQTLDLLTGAGYLRKTRAGYRIDNFDTLLDAWAHAYPTGLGANQQVFRGVGNIDRLADLKPLGWVSGERAVPELVSGGRTAHLYAWSESAIKDIIRAARLRQDDTGEVIIRSAFWHSAAQLRLEVDRPRLSHRVEDPLATWPRAPLPVIYADLLSVGDPRLSEVAQEVRNKIKERINHFNHWEF